MLKKTLCSFFIGMLIGALAVILIAPTIMPQSEQQHSLFVYGTLQNNLLRYYACYCLVSETPATVTGYKKTGLNIVPAENASVSGVLLSVSTTQLKRIDNYEHTPQRYTREKIRIDGQTHWVYIKNL
jgi:gamma-glutamylcyclotransferase (GGCT)/AIG2-like uncharacterized protein YtfP